MSDNGNKITKPSLSWDSGTAYDMFLSLQVLHEPSAFGLRAAWAAGMRSRLPITEREILEQFQKAKTTTPFHWVYGLPSPKDGAVVLCALKEMAPADRLEMLALKPGDPESFQQVFLDVRDRGTWDDSQLEEIISQAKDMHGGEKLQRGAVDIALDLSAEAMSLERDF